jgi:hypothetical protein
MRRNRIKPQLKIDHPEKTDPLKSVDPPEVEEATNGQRMESSDARQLGVLNSTFKVGVHYHGCRENDWRPRKGFFAALL